MGRSLLCQWTRCAGAVMPLLWVRSALVVVVHIRVQISAARLGRPTETAPCAWSRGSAPPCRSVVRAFSSSANGAIPCCRQARGTHLGGSYERVWYRPREARWRGWLGSLTDGGLELLAMKTACGPPYQELTRARRLSRGAKCANLRSRQRGPLRVIVGLRRGGASRGKGLCSACSASLASGPARTEYRNAQFGDVWA